MKKIGIVLLITGALFGGTLGGNQTDQETPKQAAKEEKKLAIGEHEAKRMLLLMDTDKSGKVSKQEFMHFMEQEFDRLDVNKDGELDVKELTQSYVRIRGRSR